MILSDGKSSLSVEECFMFYHYLRIKFDLRCHGETVAVDLMLDGKVVPGKIVIEKRDGGSTCVVIESFVVQSDFPSRYSVCIKSKSDTITVYCEDITRDERETYQKSSLPILKGAIYKWHSAHNGQRARILDIGGRSRSGRSLRNEFRNCDFKVLDIMEAEGVDYVADAHDMSGKIRAESFDIICSTSTFEHLLMPWKVALEINRALTVGGYVFVVTHQTVGMHDLPHDYFRYSSDSWKGIFNAESGFQIVETAMRDFVRLVPMHYFSIEPSFENAGGFVESTVLAKKVANTSLSWDVDVRSIETTLYPA